MFYFQHITEEVDNSLDLISEKGENKKKKNESRKCHITIFFVRRFPVVRHADNRTVTTNYFVSFCYITKTFELNIQVFTVTRYHAFLKYV